MDEVTSNQVQSLEEKKAAINEQMAELVEVDQMSNEQIERFDQLQKQFEAVEAQIKRVDTVAANKRAADAPITRAVKPSPGAPAVVGRRGDNERNALFAWVRRGDRGGVSHMLVDEGSIELRASNDTDMNITTAADGGYAVPTGHYGQIIARRDEAMLANRLPLQRFQGEGTTVNVPVDAEDDGEFVATSEAGTFDRDAPALTQVAMTLAMYTKKLELSYQLIDDEGSNLIPWLGNFVGRGMAKTHNNLLVTAVAAGGTAALTFDSATTIGASEVPELVYKLPDGYEDDCAWLMARTTEGTLRGLVGDNWQFVPMPMGDYGNRSELWGYPVLNSGKVAAVAASAKSVFFGNWNFVGLRESPTMTMVRDPFTLAGSGQLRLLYHFRCVYKVLQAEAILYGTHPTA